ncbi:hypothetical protein [Paenibacillus sp. SYP-B4298]|uniref:hypothetical protein n=1 Tax=Paenibacillus sp. SYP-B4298 TaxID=2996034 RepID=UPI0022DE882A|nr:hypothetical protein [Paenibacillus sp. SYP-B4298]
MRQGDKEAGIQRAAARMLHLERREALLGSRLEGEMIRALEHQRACPCGGASYRVNGWLGE